jgi:hypothetical protein
MGVIRFLDTIYAADAKRPLPSQTAGFRGGAIE